jgi:hypothetical protein
MYQINNTIDATVYFEHLSNVTSNRDQSKDLETHIKKKKKKKKKRQECHLRLIFRFRIISLKKSWEIAYTVTSYLTDRLIPTLRVIHIILFLVSFFSLVLYISFFLFFFFFFFLLVLLSSSMFIKFYYSAMCNLQCFSIIINV